MDKLTAEQRHRCMAAVHSKNTKPEILVRKYLFSQGFRFRLHQKDLPGHPDIVLRKYKAVIFVNGCFWHGHEGCKYAHLPQSNIEFWQEKISRNKARDTGTLEKLEALGWTCLVLWDCQLRPKVRSNTLKDLSNRLLSLRGEYDNGLYKTASSLMKVAESTDLKTGDWATD